MAILRHHIGMIILLSAKPQVRWIDALAIVTLVTDAHTSLYLAIGQRISQDVSVHLAAVPLDSAVSVRI